MHAKEIVLSQLDDISRQFRHDSERLAQFRTSVKNSVLSPVFVRLLRLECVPTVGGSLLFPFINSHHSWVVNSCPLLVDNGAKGIHSSKLHRPGCLRPSIRSQVILPPDSCPILTWTCGSYSIPPPFRKLMIVLARRWLHVSALDSSYLC